MIVYGYARVSTKKQKIERQIRNLIEYNSNIKIYQEKYTGTKLEGRKEFKKLLSKVTEGDTIVFDSVSRMSRNAEEGFELYKELFEKGINLVFLKEHYIDTDTYKKSFKVIELTGTDIDDILEGVNKYLFKVAEQQIQIAFDQAEKEVKDLSERTKEGLRVAKSEGRVGGIEEGRKLTTKKSVAMKKEIIKLSKEFEGDFTDVKVMEYLSISRNTYYKYKKELKEKY